MVTYRNLTKEILASKDATFLKIKLQEQRAEFFRLKTVMGNRNVKQNRKDTGKQRLIKKTIARILTRLNQLENNQKGRFDC